MKRETTMIRGSLAILAIGSLVAFPVLAAQATEAPVVPAASHSLAPAEQPAPGQPVAESTTAMQTPTQAEGTAQTHKPAQTEEAVSTPAAPASADASPAVQPTTKAAADTTVKVSADESAVAAGKALTGKIEGLTAGQTATAALVSTETASGKPADLACTVSRAGDSHGISCSVPETQPPGSYQLEATYQDDPGSDVTVASEDITVYVYAPRISGPALPVSPGTTTTVQRGGYEPGSTVDIATGSFWISGGQASVDRDGNFTFALKLSPLTPEGQYTITVTNPATSDQQQLTIYALRASVTLRVSTSTGIQGGFSTDVSGDGFSSHDTPYPVDLKLYGPDGSTALALLATGAQVSKSKLPSTTVQIPGNISPGLYQISAVAKDNEQSDARLAATWIAVFPPPEKEVVITPPTVIVQPPAVVTPQVVPAPLPAPDPAPAPAPAQVLPPLAHQLGATGIINPFGTGTEPANRIPDLNSSTSSPKPENGGSLSQDPVPSPSNTAPADPQAGGPPANQVPSAQDVWPLILVGIIAIAIGLALGYSIAWAGRRRSDQ